MGANTVGVTSQTINLKILGTVLHTPIVVRTCDIRHDETSPLNENTPNRTPYRPKLLHSQCLITQSPGGPSEIQAF